MVDELCPEKYTVSKHELKVKEKIVLKHLKKVTSEVTLYFRRIELDDDNNR